MWSLLFWFHKKRLMQNGCWIFRRCHMRNAVRLLDKHKSASVPHNQFHSMQIREEGHLVMSRMVIFSRQYTISTSLCCMCSATVCVKEKVTVYLNSQITGKDSWETFGPFVNSAGHKYTNHISEDKSRIWSNGTSHPLWHKISQASWWEEILEEISIYATLSEKTR